MSGSASAKLVMILEMLSFMVRTLQVAVVKCEVSPSSFATLLLLRLCDLREALSWVDWLSP